MKKLLALGGVALIVILIVMWRQLDSSDAAPPAPVAKAEPQKPKEPWQIAEASTPAKMTAAAPEPPKTADGKLDPRSDEFFFQHDEVVIPNLSRNAMKCYEGYTSGGKPPLHRRAKIVMSFKQKVRNGTVTIHDVQITKSTIGDAALESCFLQQVRDTTWHKDDLPDWDQDDEFVLSPERGGKKYTKANIEYVGPEEPSEPILIKGDGTRWRADGTQIK